MSGIFAKQGIDTLISFSRTFNEGSTCRFVFSRSFKLKWF